MEDAAERDEDVGRAFAASDAAGEAFDGGSTAGGAAGGAASGAAGKAAGGAAGAAAGGAKQGKGGLFQKTSAGIGRARPFDTNGKFAGQDGGAGNRKDLQTDDLFARKLMGKGQEAVKGADLGSRSAIKLMKEKEFSSLARAVEFITSYKEAHKGGELADVEMKGIPSLGCSIPGQWTFEGGMIKQCCGWPSFDSDDLQSALVQEKLEGQLVELWAAEQWPEKRQKLDAWGRGSQEEPMVKRSRELDLLAKSSGLKPAEEKRLKATPWMSLFQSDEVFTMLEAALSRICDAGVACNLGPCRNVFPSIAIRSQASNMMYIDDTPRDFIHGEDTAGKGQGVHPASSFRLAISDFH